MANYRVTAVSDRVRDWASEKGGLMRSYRVTLADEATGETIGNCEWARKVSSPPPAVGESVEGDVDHSGQYGPKFKAAARPAGGGGGRPRDPAERRSIAMQHAQKCAVTVLEVAAAHGDYKPPNASDVVNQVKTVAAALFKQVADAEADRIQ